jgi:predicted ABC-type ATPase
MRTARERGFTVHLAYICLDSAEVNVQRVRARFAQGGHDVPDADIRRRYERSLANVPLAVRIANTAWLYDNSGHTSRAVMGTRDGLVIWCADDAPGWVMRVRDNI